MSRGLPDPTFTRVIFRLGALLAVISMGSGPLGARGLGPSDSWSEHDVGWMTVRVPIGWTVESRIDGGACPLAHVQVSNAEGAKVYFSLDAECGGEWNDGMWSLEMGSEGRLVVTNAPPPLPCRQGAEGNECGRKDYLLTGLIRLGGERYLTVQVSHQTRRSEADLAMFRAIIDSARVRPGKLPQRAR